MMGDRLLIDHFARWLGRLNRLYFAYTSVINGDSTARLVISRSPIGLRR